jgi:hypothetical protein
MNHPLHKEILDHPVSRSLRDGKPLGAVLLQ